MGLVALANALRSSPMEPTYIIYAYGNELSPIGNLESLTIIQQIIKYFNKNKLRPTDFIIGGAIDRRILNSSQITSLLDYPTPIQSWNSFNNILKNSLISIPNLIIKPQILFWNLLKYSNKLVFVLTMFVPFVRLCENLILKLKSHKIQFTQIFFQLFKKIKLKFEIHFLQNKFKVSFKNTDTITRL